VRGCSARTVSKHIESIHRKLGVQSRRELLAHLVLDGEQKRATPHDSGQ
jgi:DNA-binding CsgD family transcriptional regulator